MSDIDGTTTALFDLLNAERALADDLAAALDQALDLLNADDDIAVLNAIRAPLARWREVRRHR